MNNVKSKILGWIDNQKTLDTSNQFFKKSVNIILTSKSSSLAINEFEFIIYFPFEFNGNKTGLTFIYNQRLNLLETGFISEIKTRNNISNASPVEVITNFYKKNENNFSGSIVAYNFHQNFLWEMGYNNGANSYTKRIISKPQALFSVNEVQTQSTNHGLGETSSCTSYYLVNYKAS